jgi:ferric-dicitrate binding protein FerR (iron transport regulator)
MRAIHSVLIWGILAIGGFAAEPVATVTSSGTFTLRGVTVKPEGVPYWPLVAGDYVQTNTTPIAIQFHDGSRVTLAQNSQATVESKNGKLAFRLSSGSMQFKLASHSTLALFNKNSQVLGTSGAVTTGPGVITKPVLAGRPLPPPPTSSQ